MSMFVVVIHRVDGHVDRVLREVRGHERAFGGVQVVLVGDFFQLPPVSRPGDEAARSFKVKSYF